MEPLNINSQPHDHYKLTGNMTYYTFMATIVLVMDLCFNKKSPSDNSNGDSVNNDDDETRVTKAEVMEACRSLHQDQSASGLGTAYLASLMDVLRKYKVKLRSPGNEYIGTTQQSSSTTPPASLTSYHLLPLHCSSAALQIPPRN
jgi:hypothetical protein